MNNTRKNVSLLFAYLAVGALVGIFVLYPLTMIIVWVEFAAGRSGGPDLSSFIFARFWFGFVPKLLHIELVSMFAVLGGMMGLCFGFFTRAYMNQLRALKFFEEERKHSIPEIIQGGETARVEFKSSVRWDIQEKRVNRSLEKVIAKTIAGFFNARGGDLLIGVADDGVILGLNNDYQSLKNGNADGFERMINDLIKSKLGGDLCPFLHFTFATINYQEICRITVERSPRPAYLEEGKNSAFFVRMGNSTRQLDVREALDYAKNRWHENST